LRRRIRGAERNNLLATLRAMVSGLIEGMGVPKLMRAGTSALLVA
jgi:hypothetical protein